MKVEKTENYEKVTEAVEANNGYCPCLVFKNEDSKCMCKEFRTVAQKLPKGDVYICNCGRFKAIGE